MDDLRPAEPSHAPQLAEIFRAGFESFRDWAPKGWRPPGELEADAEFEKALANPDVWARVVGPDERLAGFATVKPATATRRGDDVIPGLGHLWMLFVRRENWGEGHGRRLLAAAMEDLRTRFDEARLFTAAGNSRSCELYERAGWHRVGNAFEPHLGLWVAEYRRGLS